MRDAGHRTTDIGHRTAKKAKIIYPPPRGVDIMNSADTENSGTVLVSMYQQISAGETQAYLLRQII